MIKRNNNINKEIWKVIDNFSNYEVSTFGNIRNKTTKRILSPSDKGGYLVLSIKNNSGNYKSMKVHRIVALNFISNPKNKYTVNHIW